MSARRLLLAGAVAPGFLLPAVTGAPIRGTAGVRNMSVAPVMARPSLYRIDLEATTIGSGASGVAKLALAPSPFGIALTPDGHFEFDVDLTTSGLRAPSTLGPFTTYVAWVTTENLDVAQRLGPIKNGARIKGRVTYHKFILLVTAEKNANGEHWSGPIVLQGRSASMFLDNFSGKTFFSNGVPQ
jgi:hypothetical protein